MNEQRFEVSWATLWRVLVFVMLAILLYLVREAVGVLLVAVVVSLGLDPAVSFLERHRIPRLLGTFFVFMLGALVVTAVVYFVVPIVILEMGSFLAHFNTTTFSLFGVSLPQVNVKDFALTIDKALSFFSSSPFSISGAVGALLKRLVLVLTTVIISFYLTLERDGTERLFRAILPTSYEGPILSVFERFKVKIRRWFIAQLGLSVVVGLLVGFALSLLGVRYSFVLGILAGVFELVPIIGPILTGVIAFIVAVPDSLTLGLWTLLVFIGIQQFENHVLLPVVMGRTMQVHPVVVIISLIAGGEVAGLVGLILGVPIAVMVHEVFVYLSDHKRERALSST